MFNRGGAYSIFEKWYEYAKTHYMGPAEPGAPPAWVTFYHDPIVGFNHAPDLAGSWLWWAFYLMPLDRGRAVTFWEAIKTRFVVRKGDGAFVQPAPGAGFDDPYMTLRALALAHQAGDEATAARFRAHAEANYEPTQDEARGEFHFGFGLGEPVPRGQYNSHLMLSEVGPAGGWWGLFNEPNLGKFQEPTVSGVDYPRLGLCQAWWDGARRVLTLETYAADVAATGRPTRFRVTGLPDPARCRVAKDGQPYPLARPAGDGLEIEAVVGPGLYEVFQEEGKGR